MSNVVVYVFLLDKLAGFNKALNETLATTNATSAIQPCDVGHTQQFLNAVSNELDVEIIPSYNASRQYQTSNEVSQDASLPEEIGTPQYLTESSDTLDDYFDQENGLDHNRIDMKGRYPIKYSNNVSETLKNTNSSESDKIAPFLVAIFETLSNITAQTCAGALIAPRWVLTASNCINVLSSFYTNNTNITNHQSHYSVVAGATDPLSDGSIHNVTSVLRHQGYWSNSSRNKNLHVDVGPYMALLEIEPELHGVGLELVEEKVTKGPVMIYGWIMVKKESGSEYLRPMTMSALILSSAECQVIYNYINKDVICLFNNEKESNITQLSSGGPVLLRQGGVLKMLAVVQTDDVYIGYPLHVHYHAIKKVIENKL